jgi:hypothetical protein
VGYGDYLEQLSHLNDKPLSLKMPEGFADWLTDLKTLNLCSKLLHNTNYWNPCRSQQTDLPSIEQIEKELEG